MGGRGALTRVCFVFYLIHEIIIVINSRVEICMSVRLEITLRAGDYAPEFDELSFWLRDAARAQLALGLGQYKAHWEFLPFSLSVQ